MKNAFQFTEKVIFILEIFKFLYFPLPRFFPLLVINKLQENLIRRMSQRHSEDAYSLPIRKNGDCCGVVDNGCIHYGLNASISGQGGCLDIIVIYTRNQFQTATYLQQIARNIANAFKKLFKKSDTMKVDYQKISKNLSDYNFRTRCLFIKIIIKSKRGLKLVTSPFLCF